MAKIAICGEPHDVSDEVADELWRLQQELAEVRRERSEAQAMLFGTQWEVAIVRKMNRRAAWVIPIVWILGIAMGLAIGVTL